MAQLIVRNIDARIVQRLKTRAARHGRSAEAEHRSILEAALLAADNEFWADARRLRAETADRPQTDSALLLRQDRDLRAGLTRPRSHPASRRKRTNSRKRQDT